MPAALTGIDIIAALVLLYCVVGLVVYLYRIMNWPYKPSHARRAALLWPVWWKN